MSKYLRDETLKNLSLPKEALEEINAELISLRDDENKDIDANNDNFAVLTYIIRFDNKGFRLYSFNEAMEYFRLAKYVERFIFQLDSLKHYGSYKRLGKGIDLRFDAREPINCYISVQDDDQKWVDAGFLKLKEIIKKHENRNSLVRNAGIVFTIQILGVMAGFLLSLWIADKVSPCLKIQYPYGITFIIAFLLFSNVWAFLYAIIFRIINFFWPNITFGKKSIIYNLTKKIVIGLFLTFCITITSLIGIGIYNFCKDLIK